MALPLLRQALQFGGGGRRRCPLPRLAAALSPLLAVEMLVERLLVEIVG